MRSQRPKRRKLRKRPSSACSHVSFDGKAELVDDGKHDGGAEEERAGEDQEDDEDIDNGSSVVCKRPAAKAQAKAKAKAKAKSDGQSKGKCRTIL